MKCVFGCDTTGGVRLHSFPNHNQQPRLIKKWLEVITLSQDVNLHVKTFLHNSDPNMLNISNYKVCDYHFKREHKSQSGHVIYGAVPSTNMHTVLPSKTLSCLMEHNYSSEISSSKLSTHNIQTPPKKPDKMQIPPKPLESPPAKPFRFTFMDDEDNAKDNTDDAYVDNTKLVLLKRVKDIVCDESQLNTDSLSTKDLINSKQYRNMKKSKCKEIAIDKPAKEDILSNTDIVKRKTNVAIVDKPKLFSWQKDSEIVSDESKLNTDKLSLTKEIVNKQNTIVNNLKCKENTKDKENIPNTDNTPLYSDKDLHHGYKCDMCNGPIYMFRYACVQCVNFDLCGACEGRTAHAQHYLLRVPSPKPYGEVQQLIDTMKKILEANIKSLQSRAIFINNLLDNIKSEVVCDEENDPLSEEPDYSFESIDDPMKLKVDNNVSSPTITTPKTSVTPWVIPDPIEIRERRKDREKDNTKATPQKPIRRVIVDVNKYIQSHTEQDKMDIDHSLTSLPITTPISTKPVQVNDKRNDKATTTAPTDEPIDVDDDDIIWLDEELLKEHEIPHQRCDDTNITRHTEDNNIVTQTNEKLSTPRILNKSHERSSSNAHGKVGKTLLVALPKKVSNGNNTVYTQKLLKTIKHSLQSKVSIQVQRLSKEDITFALNKT